MEQRRLLVFSFLFILLWLGWFTAGPILFPNLFPVAEVPAPVEGEPDADRGEELVAANDAANEAQPKPDNPKAEQPAEHELPQHPVNTIVLGSADWATGYGLQVELTSVGAAIRSATLNDPRYIVAENPDKLNPRPQLRVVGNHLDPNDKLLPLERGRKALTFDTTVPEVDDELAKLDRRASTRTVSWELVKTEPDEINPQITAAATFRLVSPDGHFELAKTFRLNRLSNEQLQEPKAWDNVAAPYDVDVFLSIRNLDANEHKLDYVLQGPVGLPLENKDIARKYRDIKAGFLDEAGVVSAQTLTASDIVEGVEDNSLEQWTRPFRYIGVDVQYFAALISPADSQLEHPYFSSAQAVVIDRKAQKTESDISVEMASRMLDIPADGKVEHRFKLYMGPKRQELLAAYDAEQVFDYGWFSSISHIMVRLLNAFHGWGLPYGIAIIMLTVIVRACLFPFSKKQAASANKMKELQPLLMELRERYKDDKQKMAAAQMELYRKANFNPFGGCLIVFVQLPIFLALYQALSNAVDLRMAPFLYIDDLAAPDALFQFPFSIPFLGTDFNLLPIVTMVLFYVQQKMFMPPPTTEEMAMQQKMMNYMMIFFGFMFYHVPAGLCVYFIASSLWGLAERKLIQFLPQKSTIDHDKLRSEAPPEDGYFGRMMKRLQEAAEMQQQAQREKEERIKRRR